MDIMKEVKQVIVVRKDLNMRKGKLAAQVAHASMKVLLDNMVRSSFSHYGEEWTLQVHPHTPLAKWLYGLFTKIVLYVEFEEAITALENRCHFAKIPCAVITDAGKTEFKGQPTITCIAIGPWWADEIDLITGELPLL